MSGSNGDFILVKQNPALTYELHSAGKVKLGRYLGQTGGSDGKDIAFTDDKL